MKKIFDKKTIFSFVLGIMLCGGIVYAASYYAKDISYQSSDASWEVSNVNDAINDLYKIINENSVMSEELVDHTETSITLTEDKPIVIVYARYAQAQWTSSSNSAVTYPTITITGNYDKEISFNDGDAWWVDENSYYRKNGMTVKVFTNVKAGTKIDITGTTSRHIIY